MNIGRIHVDSRLVLAPMAGVTDLAFRQICRELGAGLTVTEMVSAKALCYQDKKSLPLLELGEGEHPCAAQIFGITGGVMEAALRTVYEVVTGNSLEERLEFTAVRGFEGIREASLQIGDLTVKVAIVHGLANAKKVLELVREGKADYHFIEVMSCPGGCIGGAGTIADPARTAIQLNKYVKEAPFADPEQSPFMSEIHVLKDDPDFEL